MNNTENIRGACAHYEAARAEHIQSLWIMREHVRRLILELKGLGISQQVIAWRLGKSQARISQWMQRPEQRAQYDGGCGEQDLARAIGVLCQMLDEISARPRR